MRLPTSAERRLALVGLLVVFSTVFLAGRASATARTSWCDSIPYADKVCAAVSGAREIYDFARDPLGYLAQQFHDGVAFLLTTMLNTLLATTRIDWTDPGFLRTYGMAFGVSSVLTVVLWLIAVVKRVFQGVPALQAVTESIGFLLLAVVVSALAPAAIAYATQLFDEAAEAMFAPVADDTATMAVSVTSAMTALMLIPGGSIIVSLLALGLLAAVSGVWLALIIRDALILSGLVFGVTVFSGLVDRSLWSHMKRWVGAMGAIIASKYVLLTTIALATGMLTSDGGGEPSIGQSFATMFTAIALFWLALYLPFQLSKFLPLLGDEIQGMYQARDDFAGRAHRLGSQTGDTFQELKGRVGSGAGSEATAEETAASSTGIGAVAVAGRKSVEVAQEHAGRTGEQSAESATRAGPTTGDETATPSQSARSGGQPGHDAEVPPGSPPDRSPQTRPSSADGRPPSRPDPWDAPLETAPLPTRSQPPEADIPYRPESENSES
ncbi:hypothetical protein [Streptomyces sp. NPDC049881]|uniref:hypothetical protein n=1 Tax=Streptomyces sp. NPDC049881 TaxID=3155778 RepID=UPI003435ED51